MKNLLTIDLESWQQLIYKMVTGETIQPSDDIVHDTEFLLEILAIHDVRATFFVLNNIAARFPELVVQIDKAGHEIASHGFSHSLVYNQSPQLFREETKKAKNDLEDLIGKRVMGYRAAEFSITRKSLWAIDILAEEGFVYDSSIFPIQSVRYGINNFHLEPQKIITEKGNSILEFPLSIAVFRGKRWPMAGGSYFRLLPYYLVKKSIANFNAEGRIAVMYFHPYEFVRNKVFISSSEIKMEMRKTYFKYKILHNFASKNVVRKFKRLLSDYIFIPVKEEIENVKSCSELLR